MGLPVLFGANVDPVWGDGDQPLRRALQADREGLDFVTVQDHPYQKAFYDTWTLMAFLAARTERVTFVPTVANLPLRPPAMLAKAAASFDLLSGGRLQLGLGAGAFWEAIEAMGGPRRTRKESLEALSEAIDVIRAMWSGERSARAGGAYYRVAGVHPGPTPSPSLGIWLGAYGPRMLELTGTKADGWMPSLGFLGLDRLGEAVARLDDAAARAGRDPAGLRKSYNLNGMIRQSSRGAFDGPVEQWVDRIAELHREYGMNGFSYWPDEDHDRQLSVFAQEVVPAAREAVAKR
ncbi:LLM class flavin-dependent oxidoreductase [Streptomyces sp. AS02]|uniref:LLM class flavin-dependent oxidoreductase n=1 Tax=Streptomyces sp. AS02 TaxID=2938946 RepID=UPI0020221AAF|nr:LLM class flavin-dependent oxidoreductase [Streptomyces sp. AS02]MCL8010070.1 LLM class flavin-dependent oxidoreductase [Streptomyces sp. AS02]